MIGDAALVLDALLAEVSRQKGPGGGNAFNSLKEEVASGKKAWLEEWGKFLNSDATPLDQYRVIRDLMKTVDRDNVIMTHDSGSPREQMMPFWETTKAGSYMGWGKSTQLGYGLGINMGAKLAEPKKLCVNVMGDAAIGMTGMDIETAARNKIAILTIVFNNGVMGAERDVLKISDEKYGSMTVGGNYTKVAEGLNVAARRVEKPGDIVGAIKEAVGVTRNRRAVPARIHRQGRPRLLALSAGGALSVPNVKLTFACGLYDRVLPLYTGAVPVEGVDLNFVNINSPREIFDRMSGSQEFDASEYSSSEFISRYCRETVPVRRDPGVSVAVVPARLHRRQSQARENREGPRRRAHRPADVHHDGVDLHQGAAGARVRRRSLQRHLGRGPDQRRATGMAIRSPCRW